MIGDRFRFRSQALLRIAMLLAALSSLTVGAAEVPASDAQLLFSHLTPSVYPVRVISHTGKVFATGSAVAVKPDIAVTNYHVILGGASVELFIKAHWHRAALALSDPKSDLALLRVSDIRLTPATMGDSNAAMVGQHVYALGSPLGLSNTFSDGMISGLREIDHKHLIQHTAPISPGSSGGALFSASGRLIGITNAALAEGQNINFAIPAQQILELLARSGSTTPNREPPTKIGTKQLIEAFRSACKRYNVPLALALALAQEESGFDSNLTLADGRAGLLPLGEELGRKMYVKNRHDAKESINGGVRYLRILANIYRGDMPKIIAAFRFSPSHIGISQPMPDDAIPFVRRVVTAYFDYKELLSRTAQSSSKRAVTKEGRQEVCAHVEPTGIVVYEMCGAMR